jgi:microcystin-dependent protein
MGRDGRLTAAAPELRQQVRKAATAAGGDVSTWVRYAVHQITVADFPASWHATARRGARTGTTGRVEMRSHRSRYHK